MFNFLRGIFLRLNKSVPFLPLFACNVSKQALQRAENLPQGMQQQVVIDIRGQAVTPVQRAQIVRGIVDKSNGAISPSSIRFKAE